MLQSVAAPHQQPGSEASFQQQPLGQDFVLRLRLIPGQRPQLRVELPVARRPPPLDSLSRRKILCSCTPPATQQPNHLLPRHDHPMYSQHQPFIGATLQALWPNSQSVTWLFDTVSQQGHIRSVHQAWVPSAAHLHALHVEQLPIPQEVSPLLTLCEAGVVEFHHPQLLIPLSLHPNIIFQPQHADPECVLGPTDSTISASGALAWHRQSTWILVQCRFYPKSLPTTQSVPLVRVFLGVCWA